MRTLRHPQSNHARDQGNAGVAHLDDFSTAGEPTEIPVVRSTSLGVILHVTESGLQYSSSKEKER
jgi:hypothetical protein